MEIKKYKYLIEFETIEENVKIIVELITKILEVYEKEIPKCENKI